jgi:hypothetical protein
MAAGQARKAAAVAVGSLLPALGMLVLFVHLWGAAGAAFSNALVILLSSAVLSVLVWQRFGGFVSRESAINIALAVSVMFLTFKAGSALHWFFLFSCGAGLVVYFAVLIVSREITRADVAAFLPWIRLQPLNHGRGVE